MKDSRRYFRFRTSYPNATAKAIEIVQALWHIAGIQKDLRAPRR